MSRSKLIYGLALVAVACGGPRRESGDFPAMTDNQATRTDPADSQTRPRPQPDLPAGPAAVTALVGATVFDGTGAEPLADAVVVLAKDRITAIGPRAQVTVPEGALVIDVAGKWITPGLIDAHVHFFQSASLYARPHVVDLRAVRPYEDEVRAVKARLADTWRRYLVTGQTAVVDMGGPMWNFEVREQAGKTLLAPRVAVAGPLISTIAREHLDVGDPPIIRAETPERARELARAQLARQPDFLKVWFIALPNMSREASTGMLAAVAEEARRAGVRLAVHATELDAAKQAVRAGADVLVHSIHDQAVDDELIELMRARDVVLIPTLTVVPGYAGVLTRSPVLSEMDRKYGDPLAVKTWAELAALDVQVPGDMWRTMNDTRVPIMKANLERLYRAGVTIAAGTDAGNIGTLPGSALHRELALMVEAGMTPRDALVAATRNAARVFSAKPEIGTLVPGNLADLLVLDADPLADIGHLARISRVVKGGVVLEPGQILAPNPAWVVQGQADAYHARDIEGFLSWYADDVKLWRHPGGELRAQGKEQMRTIYTGLFNKASELGLRILERVTTGNVVIDYELVTGIPGMPYVHAVAMYEVVDGLITQVWFLPQDP